MKLPRVQFTMRRMMVAVAVFALAFSYIGSYYRLSRRGMHEAAEYGIDGFLYVPVLEAAATEGSPRHLALAVVYAPLNWLDRHIFGAPGPTGCIMWRLSG